MKIRPKAVPYLRALLFVAVGGLVFNYTDVKKTVVDYLNKDPVVTNDPVKVDVKVNGKTYHINIVHNSGPTPDPKPPVPDPDPPKPPVPDPDPPKPVINRFIFHTVSNHDEVKKNSSEPIRSIILAESGWVELGDGGHAFSAHDIKAQSPLVKKYLEAAALLKQETPFLVVFNGEKTEKGYRYLGPVPKTLEERKTLFEKLRKGEKL